MENSASEKKLLSAVEAVLFVYGEPLEKERLLKILKKDKDLKNATSAEMETAIQTVDKNLSETSGLKLIFSGDQVQLVTKPEFSALLEDFIKEEFKENLSPASLETLSLIIYLGPLSRAQIDFYRGVNSSFILRSLLVRGLVMRHPDPNRSHIYIYESSFDLVKYLGISKVEDLPEYTKFRELARKSEEQGKEISNEPDSEQKV